MEGYTEMKRQFLVGERALFHSKNLRIYDTIFDDGESPLKESGNIELYGSMFKWKYPLWYCKDIKLKDCTLFEMARAGIWYTDNISVENTLIEAPKNFRRCRNVALRSVNFYNAQETLWNCDGVTMENVNARGDYFAMNTDNMKISNFELLGNYSFDGSRNIEMRNSRLISRDAFWNTENVTVYDSFISGEYLGWNSKNLTLVNCTVESLQGLCYIDNLVMKNCRLINTTLAFEYSSADAEITGKIDSVLNPSEGTIRADYIGELILERDLVDTGRTKILCSDIAQSEEVSPWRKGV